MNKPKSPCRAGCEYRSANCHNESCPYGWAEYERKALEFAEKVNDNRDLYYKTMPITAARRQISHSNCMKKKRMGRT